MLFFVLLFLTLLYNLSEKKSFCVIFPKIYLKIYETNRLKLQVQCEKIQL